MTIDTSVCLIELLENNKNDLPHDVYCNLCFSLCDLFSDKAFQYGKEVFGDIEAIEIDSMRERLITLSMVFGTPLSPETRKEWERKIALESQRRREHMRKKHPGLHKIGSLLRNHFGKNGEFNEANSLDENTNGLLRQFFPKGTDFNEISEEEIDNAAALLNNRPRKCLNYRTPNEVLWSG